MVGLIRGWALTLCILAVAPFILVVGVLLNYIMGEGITKNLVAYS
jgi:hypothetical protein